MMRKLAHHPVDAAHPLEVVLDEVTEADRVVEVLLPALDAAIDADGDKALLADGAAVAPGLTAGGQMGQGVGQVVELAAIERLGRHVPLQPGDLGDLHLDAHPAADIAQEVVVGGVDLVGFGQGPVVQPEDDVAVIAVVGKVGTRHGHWLVSVVGEDGERAGGIEANALDGLGVDSGLGDDLPDADGNAVPDVGGRLFLIGLGQPCCLLVRNHMHALLARVWQGGGRWCTIRSVNPRCPRRAATA